MGRGGGGGGRLGLALRGFFEEELDEEVGEGLGLVGEQDRSGRHME